MYDVVNETIKEFDFIFNVQIHKELKIDFRSFLDKVDNIENLRCLREHRKFTFFITTKEEQFFFDIIYNIVNSGNFKLDDYFSEIKIFALGLPPKILSWFKNTDYDVIYTQMINWLAADYYFDDSQKDVLTSQLYEPVLIDVQKCVKKYQDYIDKNNIEVCDDNQLDIYNLMSINLTGAKPVEILKYFGCTSWDTGWGISANYGINIIISYLKDLDWDEDIVNGKRDSENHFFSESNRLIMELWRNQYHRFHLDFSNNKFKAKLTSSDVKHFVYIIREGDRNRFKIGWTTNPKSDFQRLKQMQTGNSDKLILIDFFQVTSKNTEKVIHKYFRDFHILGEWFELSDGQVEDLKNSDWRISKNIL